MNVNIKYRVMKGPMTEKTIKDVKSIEHGKRKLYETIGSKYLRDVKAVQV